MVPLGRRHLLSLAPALLLAACARGASGHTVRIGFQRDGVLLLAQSNDWLQGELKAAGVQDVEWVLFPSGPAPA